MRVLETRETAEGYKRRRYESATGVRHTTIEVPIEVWRRVNTVGRQRDRAAEAARRLARESLARQAAMLRMSGITARAIAAALGVPKRTILRWLQNAR